MTNDIAGYIKGRLLGSYPKDDSSTLSPATTCGTQACPSVGRSVKALREH